MFTFIFQGNSGNFAKLHMTSLKYLGAVDLTQYFVKEYTFTDKDAHLNISTNGNKGVQVDFIFSRRLLNQILTVFMPTVLFKRSFSTQSEMYKYVFQIAIVIVSFCTSFFKVYYRILLTSTHFKLPLYFLYFYISGIRL